MVSPDKTQRTRWLSTQVKHPRELSLPATPRTDIRGSYLVRYGVVTLVCLLALAFIANVIAPRISAGAPFSGQILLGFNERYGAASSSHSGIDVGWGANLPLYAPTSGTISYVGKVPAAAGVGKNVTAITITTVEGYQVTLNPFAGTTLKKGDGVTKGQIMGTLSDEGDPSSAEPHVHLSLRIEGKYRDPSGLIEAVLGKPMPTSVRTNGNTTGDGWVPTPRSVPAPALAPVAVPTPSKSAQPQPETSLLPQAAGEAVAPATQGIHIPQERRALPESDALAKASTPSPVLPISASSLTSAAKGDADESLSGESGTPAGYRTLSTSQWMAVLYSLGIAIPCAGVGLITVGRKIGIRVPQITHLFAAREEK